MMFLTTKYYCPNCGKQTVVMVIENGDGDYDQGPAHICGSCRYLFAMQAGFVHDKDEGTGLDGFVQAAIEFFESTREVV